VDPGPPHGDGERCQGERDCSEDPGLGGHSHDAAVVGLDELCREEVLLAVSSCLLVIRNGRELTATIVVGRYTRLITVKILTAAASFVLLSCNAISTFSRNVPEVT
jgi:hypothetical protein